MTAIFQILAATLIVSAMSILGALVVALIVDEDLMSDGNL